MKKLLILWLITFSSVLFAQHNTTELINEAETRCNNKNYEICSSLARAYEYGSKNIAKNMLKAIELHHKACDGNELMSCVKLGYFYSNGLGVRKDSFKAVEFFQKACDANIAISCVRLGIKYFKGEGVRQDFSKSLSLYGKACDLKDTDGCQLYAQLKNTNLK